MSFAREKTDLMILGATGFTGKLVAHHLAAHDNFVSGRVTVSLAGRSISKLELLAAELGSTFPLVLVDVLDTSSIVAAVRTTRIVLNLVGPFWRWSKPVALECARNGVHYLDIAAESPFIKWLADECHSLAQVSGAVLIPVSGCESVPPDLIVHFAARTLRAAAPGAAVAHSVSAFEGKAGYSGGTLDSVLSLFDEVPQSALHASTADWACSPVRGLPEPWRWSWALPLLPQVAGGFYFMFMCDKHVVQRTWGLRRSALDSSEMDARDEPTRDAYAPNFVFEEFMITGGHLTGVFLSAVFTLVWAALAWRPVRWLIRQVIPKLGQGPDTFQLENGWLKATNVSTGVDTSTGQNIHVKTCFEGRGDPGYTLTAVFLVESGLALALDYNALPRLATYSGCLTPAAALGDMLLERVCRNERIIFTSEVIVARNVTHGSAM